MEKNLSCLMSMLHKLYKKKMLSEWIDILEPALNSEGLRKAIKFVRKQKKQWGNGSIFPQEHDMFSAFKYTDPDRIKVVILGGTPIGDLSHDIGLAYSSLKDSVAPNEDIADLYKELKRTRHTWAENLKKKYETFNKLDSQIKSFYDMIDSDALDPNTANEVEERLRQDEGRQLQELDLIDLPDYPGTTDCTHFLEMWAHQGVLLLNTALTVNIGLEEVHIEMWKDFTKEVLKTLDSEFKYIAYLSWDPRVQDLLNVVDSDQNLVLKPKDILHSDAFINVNKYISNYWGTKKAIDWSLGAPITVKTFNT